MPGVHSCLTAALLGAVAVSGVLSATEVPKARYATGHVLIKFHSDVRIRLPAVPEDQMLPALLSRLNLPAGSKLEEPVVNHLLRERAIKLGRQITFGVNLDRFVYLKLPPGLSVEECVARMKTHPWVEYVEPDGIGTAALVPNDPGFSEQWYHTNSVRIGADIHTPQAWSITQGSSNVLVALLDTGLAGSQPEFAGRVVGGYNFVAGTTNTDGDRGHGTLVAGILAANANNSNLGAGVDWNCRLMPVKAIGSNGFGYYSWFAQGTDYAVAHGAKVIGLLVAGDGSSIALNTAISNAVAAGAIVVTAAGNNNGAVSYPGNLPLCITVGATDYQTDVRAWFSNYGPELDLVAPGESIYSVYTNAMAYRTGGTSAATPQVAGVCALMAALRPDLTQEQARVLLCAGANDQVGDPSYDTPGFDHFYGWGRLNAYNSLVLAQTRIDSIRWSNNVVELSWASPPNASMRQPYQIEFAARLPGPWTAANSSTNHFRFEPTRTHCLATNSASAGFYRLSLRQSW